MIKLNKSMVMSAGVPWCPRFVSSLPPRDGFWNSPSDHETWCIGCHTRIHVVHLAFTYYVGPSSVMCSELGLALPFPPMRVLEVHGHGLSVSCVKWPLSSSNKVPSFHHNTLNRIFSVVTTLPCSTPIFNSLTIVFGINVPLPSLPPPLLYPCYEDDIRYMCFMHWNFL